MPDNTQVNLAWNDDVIRKIAEVPCRTKLEVVGIAMTNDIKQSFRETKSGKAYVRKTRVHQASAPGETPAIDTGRLMSSISYDVTNGRSGGGSSKDPRVEARPFQWPLMELAVGTKTDYAPELELGSKRIAARPFLRPALDRAQGVLKKEFNFV